MGTRRENRPVSMTVANGLLTLEMRLPCARPAEPRARDPPSPSRGSHQRYPGGLRSACHDKPAREDLPLRKAQNGERRCDNIASPERRTRKASPSYS
jgi:hypothetical protein